MSINFECSSFCCCNALTKMQESFVAKFRLVKNNNIVEEGNSNSNGPFKKRTEEERAIQFLDPEPSCSTSNGGHKNAQSSAAGQQNVEDAENNESVLNGSLGYEVLKHDSKTPAPLYELMKEAELNAELTKYGHGPMGKRAAINLLNKIYEATHPVISTSTPLPRRIKRTLASSREGSANNKDHSAPERQREKRTKQKIGRMLEEQRSGGCAENSGKIVGNENESGNDVKLTQAFLDWLRLEENGQIYNELLSLNPILIDHLFKLFGPKLKELKASKQRFAELLDSLGVTYCLRTCNNNNSDGKHY